MKSLVAALCAGVSFAGMAHADDMFSGVVAAASDDGATTFEFARLDPSVMQMQPGETVTMNFGAGYEAELDRKDVAVSTAADIEVIVDAEPCRYFAHLLLAFSSLR